MSCVKQAQVIIVVTMSVGYVCYIKQWSSDKKYFGKAKYNIKLETWIRNVKKEIQKLI